MLRQLTRAYHRILRHRLTEGDGRGLDRLVAVVAVGRTAIRIEALLYPGQIVGATAADAARIGCVAVQLDDMIGGETGRLMQIVDVLGDDRRNLARTIERGERTMPSPRLRSREGLLHRKTATPGLVARVPARHKLVERDRTVARPQAARRAKIWNAALSGDAGAGEGHDDAARGDHVAEPLHRALNVLGNHS